MSDQETPMSEKESLALITTMINTARNAYHETGIGAIMWGIIITVCSLVRLAEIHFDVKLPFDIYLLTIFAVIPQVFLSIKANRNRTVRSFADVYLDYIWLTFGIAIFLLIVIVNSVFSSWGPVATEYRQLTGHPAAFRFNEFIAPLFLLLYGLPTFITGAACKFPAMLFGGIFCWVCCLVTLYTPLKVDLLLTAAAAIMAWLLPGMMMEKEYRKYKKERAGGNV